jgi:hypothetical protein
VDKAGILQVVADRRYSTARWQKLRKAVLYRDGHVCRVRGPNCTGYATSVHHVVPSSKAPHLFWAESNLLSSCAPCNYGGGRRIAVENGRRRIERLEEIIVEQDGRIQRLLERVAELESERPASPPRRTSPKPMIY